MKRSVSTILMILLLFVAPQVFAKTGNSILPENNRHENSEIASDNLLPGNFARFTNLAFNRLDPPGHLPNSEKQKENQRIPRVALMYVGHGEPAAVEDGDIPITFPDGTPFGPHGTELGVPPMYQYTEWAAAYEEIATALSYIFSDINGNGIIHELGIVPAGDVPGFFTWDAFHATIYSRYEQCNNYSPHNDTVRAHVDSLDISVKGAKVDVYLALLDEVPRIPDVVYQIAQGNYDELVVVPMLVANSTHTDEITGQLEEVEHLTAGMDVLVAEPFFEVPYMRKSLRDAIVSMSQYIAQHIPEDVADYNIGVVLASHGTPYVPPFPEFGWVEGEIYSELIPTEDAFHDEIATTLPWISKTGRMNYSTPEIKDALEAFEKEGFTHVMVVPSAFPTAAIHTMYDVANSAVGRPVLPSEGVVEHERPSGMKVYYTAEGIADLEPGRSEFRAGLEFLGRIAVMEALHKTTPVTYEAAHIPPDVLQLVLASDLSLTKDLQFFLYETTQDDWPSAYETLPMPDWIVDLTQPAPENPTTRMQISLAGNLINLSGKSIEGRRIGLAVVSSDTSTVTSEDIRGFSTQTAVYSTEAGLDFGRVAMHLPDPPCQAGEICLSVTADEVTGPDIKLMLYKTTQEAWPREYLTLPTPAAVVTQTVPVPDSFPVTISIPLQGNLFTFSGEELVGERLGLVVVTGVAANFVVEPTDARGFS
ncbi:MAG: ferrochelatase, partial [Desulfobulbales bacterium]|nr:ferrochelatase [Desulfobulbales bacterium]